MSRKIIQIDDELRELDTLSLRDLGNFFEKWSEICHAQAAEYGITLDEKHAGAIDFLMRTPRLVSRRLRQGCTLLEAQQHVADMTGAPLRSVQNYWKRFVFDKSLYEVRRRNRLIIELAGMGFTNVDIGKKLSLHPGSVSRIIGAARRAYHLPREQQKEVQALLPTNLEHTIFR